MKKNCYSFVLLALFLAMGGVNAQPFVATSHALVDEEVLSLARQTSGIDQMIMERLEGLDIVGNPQDREVTLEWVTMVKNLPRNPTLDASTALSALQRPTLSLFPSLNGPSLEIVNRILHNITRNRGSAARFFTMDLVLANLLGALGGREKFPQTVCQAVMFSEWILECKERYETVVHFWLTRSFHLRNFKENAATLVSIERRTSGKEIKEVKDLYDALFMDRSHLPPVLQGMFVPPTKHQSSVERFEANFRIWMAGIRTDACILKKEWKLCFHNHPYMCDSKAELERGNQAVAALAILGELVTGEEDPYNLPHITPWSMWRRLNDILNRFSRVYASYEREIEALVEDKRRTPTSYGDFLLGMCQNPSLFVTFKALSEKWELGNADLSVESSLPCLSLLGSAVDGPQQDVAILPIGVGQEAKRRLVEAAAAVREVQGELEQQKKVLQEERLAREEERKALEQHARKDASQLEKEKKELAGVVKAARDIREKIEGAEKAIIQKKADAQAKDQAASLLLAPVEAQMQALQEEQEKMRAQIADAEAFLEGERALETLRAEVEKVERENEVRTTKILSLQQEAEKAQEAERACAQFEERRAALAKDVEEVTSQVAAQHQLNAEISARIAQATVKYAEEAERVNHLEAEAAELEAMMAQAAVPLGPPAMMPPMWGGPLWMAPSFGPFYGPPGPFYPPS